jgi:hypothetical protein
MSYIVNQARVHSLTIGGTDYSAALISWAVSDSSANRNGFIVTSGSLSLGSYPNGPDIEDYDRNDFKRGVQVILTMEKPDGSTYRHPRGLLYVISTSYDVEAEALNVELGCRLALAKIMDDPASVLGLSPIQLDPAQQQLNNISAAFAASGKCLYQNNQGELVERFFFDGDSVGGVASGEWTSILGVTALSASPLAASGAIPDSVKLTYQIPAGSISNDQKGRIDTTEVFSNYWLDYPASLSVRTGPGTIDGAGGLNPGSEPPGPGNDPCGNTPTQPGGNGKGSCQENYTVESRPWILPAKRYEISKTYYNGPGGQQDYSERKTYGPIVEANSQHFADSYAYCVGIWASSCQPGGRCYASGMTQALLSMSTTRNYFGEANELVKQVQEEYVNYLSMARPQDWRTGISAQGIPQIFRYFTFGGLVRSQVTITEYYKEDNANLQKTTTYTSVGQNGSGISVGLYKLDAYNGVVTSELRRSTSTATLDVAPDIVNTATTTTVDQTVELPLFTGRYQTPPVEAGPYVLEEQMPVPVLLDTEEERGAAVEAYSEYLVRFIKGDAFGLQVGEGLREDVAENWYPGMPFRYYDPGKGKVLALRMDATSWGVTPTESAFVTNGIWVGKSNGSVTLPSNIVGASSVTDGGSIDPLTTAPNGPTAPAPPVVTPPPVDNETVVDNGSFAWVVKVNIKMKSTVQAINDLGVQPPAIGDQYVQHYQTMVAYCQGMVVQTGGLLSPTGSGGVPVEAGGSLITENATVVTADLFA